MPRAASSHGRRLRQANQMLTDVGSQEPLQKPPGARHPSVGVGLDSGTELVGATLRMRSTLVTVRGPTKTTARPG